MYSQKLLDYFQNPRNAGEVENPDAAVQIENPACGDVLRLSARIDGDHIVAIRFRAKGCVPAMACGSALTELVAGKSLQEARQLTRETLIDSVGGVPETSSHAGHLAMDALGALLKKLA
jgi:nitrogen fixation NifU-like protein